MKKRNKVASIEIELEDFEPIKLKLDEAKELYEQLHTLFGDKEVKHVHHYDYWWNRPYYTVSSPSIWLTDSSGTGVISSGTTTTTSSVLSSNTGMKVTYLCNAA